MKKLYFRLRELLLVNKIMHVFPRLMKPFVLCYHQIDTHEFEAQLKELKKKFEIVDLSTFVIRVRNNQKGGYCAVTLDDCIRRDIQKAVPVCRKHGVPITFFLPVRFCLNDQALPGTKVQRFLAGRSEFVLQGNSMRITESNAEKIKNHVFEYFDSAKFKIDELDALVKQWFAENNVSEDDIIVEMDKILGEEEVKVLALDRLFSFQSHTFNHESLGLCTQEEIIDEFERSKLTLEKITKRDVNALCYPYGSREIIGEKVFLEVSKFYNSAFSLVQGACHENIDPYFMPRIGIYPGDDLIDFRGKIYHNMQRALMK